MIDFKDTFILQNGTQKRRKKLIIVLQKVKAFKPLGMLNGIRFQTVELCGLKPCWQNFSKNTEKFEGILRAGGG